MCQILKSLLMVSAVMQFAHGEVTSVDESNLESTIEDTERRRLGTTREERERSLIEASTKGDVDLVRDLITSGVDINTKNEDNYTALMIATANNYIDIVKLLINADANLDIQNVFKNTALIFAVNRVVLFNETEICKLLLNAGADVNIYNSFGMSALRFAILYKELDLIKMLLEKNARVNDIQVQNLNNTNLHDVAKNGDIEIAEILIRNGANLNTKNTLGETPLAFAVKFNRTEMVTYLRSIGAAE